MKYVKCIENNFYLTINKIYECIEIYDKGYLIKSDIGLSYYFPKNLFVDLRILKLKQLL